MKTSSWRGHQTTTLINILHLHLTILIIILFNHYINSVVVYSYAQSESESPDEPNPKNKLAAAVFPAAVVDTDGHQVEVGVEYYITSAFWGAGGGGIILDVIRNQTCPISVIQLQYDTQYGLPLTLHPAHPNQRVIRESSDINIKFQAPISCADSTVLKVSDYDEITGKRFVRIGGKLGDPGCATVSNWFKIEMVGPGYYKLVHRPTVCEDDDDEGAWPVDVGIYKEERMRLLALTGDVPPFLLAFKKVLYDDSL